MYSLERILPQPKERYPNTQKKDTIFYRILLLICEERSIGNLLNTQEKYAYSERSAFLEKMSIKKIKPVPWRQNSFEIP